MVLGVGVEPTWAYSRHLIRMVPSNRLGPLAFHIQLSKNNFPEQPHSPALRIDSPNVRVLPIKKARSFERAFSQKISALSRRQRKPVNRTSGCLFYSFPCND